MLVSKQFQNQHLRKGGSLSYRHSVGIEIRAVGNLLCRELAASKGVKYVDELTGATSRIIGFLADNRDRDMFQRDVEKEFLISRSTASKALSFMEKKGLIRREAVAHDARLKKLVLTERALCLDKIAEADMEGVEERLTDGLTEEELKMFVEIIKKMRKNLESGGKK